MFRFGWSSLAPKAVSEDRRIDTMQNELQDLKLRDHVWHQAPRPRNIAHRGYKDVAPENTVAAFKAAVTEGTFWGAEADIRLTKDGHWVCMHDETIDRTTDGTGLVSDLTLDEIKQLDAGSWFSPEFAGELVPTLGEFLFACYVARLVPYIEIKGGASEYSDEELRLIVDEVERQDMVRQAVVIASNRHTLARIREMQPHLVVGYISSTFSEARLGHTVALGNSFFDLGGVPTEQEAEIIRYYREQYGLQVESYGVNVASDAILCFQRGVSAITTDTLDSLTDIVSTLTT